MRGCGVCVCVWVSFCDCVSVCVCVWLTCICVRKGFLCVFVGVFLGMCVLWYFLWVSFCDCVCLCVRVRVCIFFAREYAHERVQCTWTCVMCVCVCTIGFLCVCVFVSP